MREAEGMRSAQPPTSDIHICGHGRRARLTFTKGGWALRRQSLQEGMGVVASVIPKRINFLIARPAPGARLAGRVYQSARGF